MDDLIECCPAAMITAGTGPMYLPILERWNQAKAEDLSMVVDVEVEIIDSFRQSRPPDN